MESWLWNAGYGILPVESWLWNSDPRGSGSPGRLQRCSGRCLGGLGDLWLVSGEFLGGSLRDLGGSGTREAARRPGERLGGFLLAENIVFLMKMGFQSKRPQEVRR